MEKLTQKLGRFKSSKLFVTFFMILVIGITVSIIATAAFLYYHYGENFRNELGISCLGQLKQASTNIDLVLSEIERTSGQFLYDEQIGNTMKDIKLKKESFLLSLDKLGQRIKVIQGWNKVIHSIYIYLEDEEKSYVISSINGEIYPINDFYDIYWLASYDDEMAYSEVLPTRKFVKGEGYMKDMSNIITHIRPVPFPNIKRGAIIINIDESKLTQLITDSIVRDSERFLAVNEAGDILLSSDKSLLYTNINAYKNMKIDFSDNEGYYIDQLDGKDIFITYTTSDSQGWRYISLTPTDIVYRNIRDINRKIILICVLFILAGIIISFVLSSSIYKPIYSLLHNIKTSMNLKEKKEYRDEVGFLNETFGEIFGENKYLEQTVESALPALREKFFRTLISSGTTYDEDYEEQLAGLHIQFRTDYFLVVIFEVNDKDRQKMVKTDQAESLINSYIKNLIQNELLYSQLSILIQETTDNHICVIVNFDASPSEAFTARMYYICESIVKKCMDYLNIRLYSALGRQVESIHRLPESYGSALEVLKYKQLSGKNNVLSFDEIENHNFINMDTLYEKEERLIKYFAACDAENSKLVIREIMDSLTVQKTEYRNIKIMLLRILGSIGKSADKLAIRHSDILDNEKMFNDAERLETLDDIEEYLCEKCQLLIERYRKKISGRNWQIVEKIKEYIQVHIAEDISLDQVVSISRMSSSHFSRVFKEEMGSTFVEYLNSVRIEKAKQLLENTGFKIKEISSAVGFGNETYFITIFKNLTGMTPNNYKSMQLWKKAENDG